MTPGSKASASIIAVTYVDVMALKHSVYASVVRRFPNFPANKRAKPVTRSLLGSSRFVGKLKRGAVDSGSKPNSCPRPRKSVLHDATADGGSDIRRSVVAVARAGAAARRSSMARRSCSFDSGLQAMLAQSPDDEDSEGSGSRLAEHSAFTEGFRAMGLAASSGVAQREARETLTLEFAQSCSSSLSKDAPPSSRNQTSPYHRCRRQGPDLLLAEAHPLPTHGKLEACQLPGVAKLQGPGRKSCVKFNTGAASEPARDAPAPAAPARGTSASLPSLASLAC